jgi:hypothetical protein
MARLAVEILLSEQGSYPQLNPVKCSLVPRGSVASAKVRA